MNTVWRKAFRDFWQERARTALVVLAIARALANEPPLVLADEPTGNLDSVTATAILDLFRFMANDGTTVVIATHEADIARVIDRRIEISDGEIHPQITQTFK